MSGPPKLDRIDINILVQLQKDGATGNLLPAEQVGLSPSPCLQRVKRPEKAKCGVHRNVVRFLAPLVLPEEDLRQALAILDTALASEQASIAA